MLIRLLLIALLALPTAAFAQTADTTATPPPPSDTTMDHQVEAGAMFGADNDISSKFNEYRDLGNGIRIFNLRFLGNSSDNGRFFETTGTNLGGDDQSFAVRAGRYGSWSAALEYDRLPHRLTNDAFSPYSYQGNGVFTVPAVVGILTTTPDNVNFRASDMLENDRRIASYLGQYLAPLPELGTQNNRLTLDLAWAPTAAFEARFSGTAESREGEKITYGTLGDRPPRTMNVEIPEPIDYNESTTTFDLAYAHRLFDLTFELLAPQFENNVDTMRWQSMYFGPDSNGALDYNNDIILAGDAIARRATSTWGQRALFPDNDYTNATLSFGMNTAMTGRFTATIAAGRLRQDVALLPYSYSTLTTDWNSLAKLPRSSAQAAMDTTLIDLQYVFNPLRGLRVRPFVRSYDLSNDTPQDDWWYVTQDTASNTTGSATYKNKRTNLAYDFGRRNAGVEATWQARKLTVGAQFEQEAIDRDFREADTDELIARFNATFRPTRRLSFRGRYTLGQRDADEYDATITTSSYWYAPADAGTDPDNPAYSFTNHPDMRRFDVTDRSRNELDLSATFNATDTLSFGASLAARNQDFDSDVSAVQPLAGTAFGGANNLTPGVQLGLLAQDTTRLSFDANWNPSDRWGVFAFASVDTIDSEQKGMAYNEMTRTSSQTPLLASPGQAWTDERNIWRVAHDDATTTVGLGLNYTIIPDRLTLAADYAMSNGTVDLAFSGYGNDKPLDTTYYAFRSPETSKHLEHTANLSLDYELAGGFTLGFRYLFNDYDVEDWMQEPEGGWVDVVNENFVRDSTLDNRWGNRLPRLGGILGPSYNANVGFITLGYRW